MRRKTSVGPTWKDTRSSTVSQLAAPHREGLAQGGALEEVPERAHHGGRPRSSCLPGRPAGRTRARRAGSPSVPGPSLCRQAVEHVAMHGRADDGLLLLGRKAARRGSSGRSRWSRGPRCPPTWAGPRGASGDGSRGRRRPRSTTGSSAAGSSGRCRGATPTTRRPEVRWRATPRPANLSRGLARRGPARERQHDPHEGGEKAAAPVGPGGRGQLRRRLQNGLRRGGPPRVASLQATAGVPEGAPQHQGTTSRTAPPDASMAVITPAPRGPST